MLQSRPIEISDSYSAASTPAAQVVDSRSPASSTHSPTSSGSSKTPGTDSRTAPAEGQSYTHAVEASRSSSEHRERLESSTRRNIAGALDAHHHQLSSASAPRPAAVDMQLPLRMAPAAGGVPQPAGGGGMLPAHPYSTYPPLQHFEHTWRWLVWAAAAVAYFVTLPWQVRTHARTHARCVQPHTRCPPSLPPSARSAFAFCRVRSSACVTAGCELDCVRVRGREWMLMTQRRGRESCMEWPLPPVMS